MAIIRLVRMPELMGLTRTWARAVAPDPELRVADNPAHRVACGNRNEFLSGLERDVGYLAGARVEPIKRALRYKDKSGSRSHNHRRMAQ